MPASRLEFHVEERSMEAFLAAWLPRFLPEGCGFGIFSYQGKDALLRKIGDRLKGYAKWMPTEYRILVIVDRDEDDCAKLKSKLEQICDAAGLRSRRAAGGPDWQVVTRIAIEELEAWYFGGWTAVLCGISLRIGEHSTPCPLPEPGCNHGRHMGGIRKNPAEARILQAGAGEGGGCRYHRQTLRPGGQRIP